MRHPALVPALAALLMVCGCDTAPTSARAEAKPATAEAKAAAAPVATTPAPAPAAAPAAPAPVAAAALQPGLAGEFFSLSEGPEDFPTIADATKPTLVRVDGQLNVDATDDAFPGTQLTDHFYARWTGVLRVPKDGKYTLAIESDDGSRLAVDGHQVIDNNGLHAMEEKTADVDLKAGDHPIKVEFYENDGQLGLKLSWSAEGVEKAIIPASALFHASH
ncbi:MAG: hypothetical protein H0X38_14835 [Planctomycetes bacterium]|nr:hypothetical protein [Planctomycetota bacterium]